DAPTGTVGLLPGARPDPSKAGLDVPLRLFRLGLLPRAFGFGRAAHCRPRFPCGLERAADSGAHAAPDRAGLALQVRLRIPPAPRVEPRFRARGVGRRHDSLPVPLLFGRRRVHLLPILKSPSPPAPLPNLGEGGAGFPVPLTPLSPNLGGTKGARGES